MPRKIIPPAYLMTSLLLMFILDRYLPVQDIISSTFNYSGFKYMAIFVGLSGFALIASGALYFKKSATAIRPFETSTALVKGGPYRFTRNPMYLGMVLILIGTAIYLGSLAPWFIIPVFFLIIQEWFIKHEEPFLENIFGKEYQDYRTKVRRWI
ncbi:MAG: isoprenylcysteine carboxylmethyltransferase family protein [Proteobacteria bacterium]|nr:isoprenylcysteine carboxylmethyltransferase family protein [Pseudomonadota bacterium]